MRLYVTDDKEKIYIDYLANNRKEIANKIGSTKIKINGKKFFVKDIKAVSDNSVATTTAIGGVVGLFGGLPGLIAGSIIGGLIGNSSDNNDKIKTEKFNKSKV